VPEPVDYQILYEDEHSIIVNKPRGLVVHPGAGNYHGTLIQGILFDNKEIHDNFTEEKIRPGVVHRLDKDTSGVMIVAKTNEALFFLTRQFSERQVDKMYIAVVEGEMRHHAAGVIETYIGRDPVHRQRFRNYQKPGDHVKYAKTEYTVLKVYKGATLVRLKLHTGRTHQIRLHMKHLGFPVAGDPIYGKKHEKNSESAPEGLLLHALSLTVVLPGNRIKRQFTAPMPDRFKAFLKRHRAENGQP
jgi:23S rRNA pseudouridine1911/1915/1917 synthase